MKTPAQSEEVKWRDGREEQKESIAERAMSMAAEVGRWRERGVCQGVLPTGKQHACVGNGPFGEERMDSFREAVVALGVQLEAAGAC